MFSRKYRLFQTVALTALCLLASGSAHAQVPGEASKLHLILTGYTRPDNVGEACQKDIDAMKHVFQQAFAQSGWQQRLIVHDLSGNDWSGSKVMQYLQQMPVGADEVVVFFHSGHGGDMIPGKESDSHMLSLNWGHVNRGEVRQVLLQKGARGLVLLTDCCSAYANQQVVHGRSIIKTANAATVRNLFLKAAKLIDITAAQNGASAISVHSPQMSGTGAESAMTVAFLWTLAEQREYVTWQDFFASLSRHTEQASERVHKPHAFFLQESSVAGVPNIPSVPSQNIPFQTGPILQSVSRSQTILWNRAA